MLRTMTTYLVKCQERAETSINAATHFRSFQENEETWYTPCFCIDGCGVPGTFKIFEPNIRVINSF